MTSNGYRALLSDHGVSASYRTIHGPADDTRVDEWELKASRRALANLRELLYRQPMFDLLKDQLAEAERLHRSYLAESNGEWAETEVRLHATGMTTEEFVPGIMAILANTAGTEEDRRSMAFAMSFPLHPEHYAVPPFAGVAETMGGIPTLTRVARDENPPEFVLARMDESYSLRAPGKGELEDGTPHSYVLQQFRDIDSGARAGIEASLRIWYPAACPPVYLEEHAEHYAVESRNLLRLVAAQNGR